VGTELVDCKDPLNAIGNRYAAQVPPSWDLESIYASGLGEGVTRQEFPSGQPRFQVGFDWDGREASLQGLHHRLAGGTGFHILASFSQYIDVLPEAVGKGRAVEFLQKELKLDPGRVMVAGDTGNDREMFETGFKGVVPVNALDELKRVACQPWHYHSPLPAAQGVLDGLVHFGFAEPG
jgi:hydroxymethylpyrimidine pyrophosphatase-like HAD family hydrolase